MPTSSRKDITLININTSTFTLGTVHGEKVQLGGLCGVVFVYMLGICLFCLTGATLFMVVDGPSDRLYESEQKSKCNETKIKILKRIAHADAGKLVSESGDTVQRAFDELLVCLQKGGGITYPVYKYENAVVYVVSTFTTMGYGNVNTKSTFGRTLSILYSYFGIPLFLGFYVDCSQAFRLSILHLVYWTGLSTRLQPEDVPRLRVAPKFTRHKRHIRRITLAATTLLFLVYLVLASLITTYMQPEWDLMTSLYFIFNSLTLIGYGDVMPDTGLGLCLIMPMILIGTMIFGVIALIVQEEIQRSLLRVTGRCIPASNEKVKTNQSGSNDS